MGVKSFIKKSVSFVSAIAMACSMVVMPAGASYATTDSTTTSTSGLELSKKIDLQEDGNYKITLEAYSTGEDTTVPTERPAPLDIVLVLDQSGSMDNKIISYNYIAQASKNYSYNSYGSSSYYYKDGDQYYQVKRGYDGWNTKYYYLYYTKGGKKYYLNGSSTTNNRPNITSKTATIWTGVLYTRQQTTTTRLEALKTAVTNFVSTVKDKASDEVNHRIAMVGFARGKSSNPYYLNTELFIGSNQYTYGNISDDNYRNAFQDITTQAGQNNIKSSIGALDAEGATRADLGMEIANNIFSKNSIKESENRKRVVVMFTDGEPNNSSGFNNTVATNTISQANKSKQTYGASVFTVGILNGASPSGPITGETTNDNTPKINRYMHYTSSNFPNANGLDDAGEGGEAKADGYYKVATDSEGLNDVFQTISDTVTTPSTTVTLTDKSVLRDVISENFTLPEGKTKDQIVSVYTDTSSSVKDDGTIVWSNDPQSYDINKVSINGNKVDVTGFDYSNKYVTKSHPGEKLIVEILVNGLKSGKDMDSNDTLTEQTGIYASSSETTPQVSIESPTVDIPEYSYVLDYGKKVVLPNVDANTKNVYDDDQSKNYSATTMMNTGLAAPTDSTSIKDTYGTFKLESNQLTYQPGKINWDGFDSIFTFGTRGSDSKYEWYKTNVIPATSVYYEDDFGSFTTNNPNNNSEVAIVWGGTWDTATDKLGEGENSKTDNNQQYENKQYGWDSSYSDDNKFSNGSAHVTNDINATATFTFTGTGVDVYSKTDGNVGLIMAQLYKKGSSAAIKTFFIDNISVSGEYYQIPTLSFKDLDYGTYDVVIRAGGKGSGGGTTYYLDGIRVYNPLGVAPSDSTVTNAYTQAGEYNATFKEVRDILLDASNFTSDEIDENGNIKDSVVFDKNGAVFIDQIENEENGSVTTKIGTYKDYGPKNEVYLAPDQLIAFEINSGYEKLFIGAKSPTGTATEMTVTNYVQNSDGTVTDGSKEINIAHSSDMYYEVNAKDSNGKKLVVVTNTGSELLSITKVRATGKGYTMSLTSSPDLMNYVKTFSSLDVFETDESGMVIKPDDTDVDIDNPSNEEDADNTEDNSQKPSNSIWQQIINSMNKWFKR